MTICQETTAKRKTRIEFIYYDLMREFRAGVQVMGKGENTVETTRAQV